MCVFFSALTPQRNGMRLQLKKVGAFPNCIGALNGKHIAIRPPPNSRSMFYCKCSYWLVFCTTSWETNVEGFTLLKSFIGKYQIMRQFQALGDKTNHCPQHHCHHPQTLLTMQNSAGRSFFTSFAKKKEEKKSHWVDHTFLPCSRSLWHYSDVSKVNTHISDTK